jgi:ABC-2 type transport system ATP-binding protein
MIETQNLTMHYGAVTAVDNASFKVNQGEVIGLLGPNGAGKSTTLKIITTYLYPSAGTAHVAGKDVRHDPLSVRKMIGYLPEQLPLYTEMEVGEYLDFVGKARAIHGSKLAERVAWVKEKCGLKPVYRKIIRELSKGYRQRTALAQALIHDPEIVILDEPTSGLDPHQILEIRGLIAELAKQNKTIIFSTHILQEVQAVTSRIIVINRGKIVADGKLDELEHKAMSGTRCEIVLSSEVKESEVREALSKVADVDKVTNVAAHDGQITYTVLGKTGAQLQRPLAELITQKGWAFFELKRKPYSLEEIFLRLTEPERKDK